MTLLDTIAGVARQSAELLFAEVGTDIQRFPTAAHLCKWAGVCPGNHESAGRQYSGKTPPSNRWLRGMLVQMANAAKLQKVLLRHRLSPLGSTTRTQTCHCRCGASAGELPFIICCGSISPIAAIAPLFPDNTPNNN